MASGFERPNVGCNDMCLALSVEQHHRYHNFWNRLMLLHELREAFDNEYNRLKDLERQVQEWIEMYKTAIDRTVSV